jgi:Domain of unknown function (DUF4558)
MQASLKLSAINHEDTYHRDTTTIKMRSNPGKASNPEKRYQAGVIREGNIQSLLHSTKLQNNYLASAKWECALGVRDVSSQKKWLNHQINYEARMTDKAVKRIRCTELESLYRTDDKIFEEELHQLGLSSRKERP